MVGCEPIYFPVDSTLLLNIRHDTCSSSAGFSIWLNFLSSKKAKRTREKQRAVASSSKRPPKLNAAATCRSSFSTAVQRPTRWRRSQRARHANPRVFLWSQCACVHTNSISILGFVFAGGGGGGGGGKICHGSKSFAVCHERTVLCMSLPNICILQFLVCRASRFKFSDQNRHSFMLDRWNWRSISLI